MNPQSVQNMELLSKYGSNQLMTFGTSQLALKGNFQPTNNEKFEKIIEATQQLLEELKCNKRIQLTIRMLKKYTKDELTTFGPDQLALKGNQPPNGGKLARLVEMTQVFDRCFRRLDATVCCNIKGVSIDSKKVRQLIDAAGARESFKEVCINECTFSSNYKFLPPNPLAGLGEMPYLQILRITNCDSSKATTCLEQLKCMTSLRVLEIRHTASFHSIRFKEMFESVPHLEELALSNVGVRFMTEVSSAGALSLELLMGVRYLRTLNLSSNTLFAHDLANLEHLPHLEELNLSYCSIVRRFYTRKNINPSSIAIDWSRREEHQCDPFTNISALFELPTVYFKGLEILDLSYCITSTRVCNFWGRKAMEKLNTHRRKESRIEELVIKGEDFGVKKLSEAHICCKIQKALKIHETLKTYHTYGGPSLWGDTRLKNMKPLSPTT